MMTNIECLLDACKLKNVSYKVLDEHSNFIAIGKHKHHYFIQTKTPFNYGDFERICKDKDYTYKVLGKDVRMPRTLPFLDPNVDEKYDEYKKERSYDEIVDTIRKEFQFPLVIKMNSGSVGKNVYLCKDDAEALNLIRKIFNHADKDYDYMLLAQEYINIAKEYRVVVYKGKVEFAYLKDTSGATFDGNLSPLHWEGGKAVLVEDLDLQSNFQKICDKISEHVDLNWAGLDIAINNEGEMVLIEMNSSPSFAYFVKDNGRDTVVQLYIKALSEFVEDD